MNEITVPIYHLIAKDDEVIELQRDQFEKIKALLLSAERPNFIEINGNIYSVFEIRKVVQSARQVLPEIEKHGEDAYKLVECSKCKLKFYLHAIEKHETNCGGLK